LISVGQAVALTPPAHQHAPDTPEPNEENPGPTRPHDVPKKHTGAEKKGLSHPLSTLDKLQERRKRRTRRGRGSPGQQEATPQRPQERNREASVPPAKGCRAPRRGTCREGHPRRSRPPLCPHVKTPVLPQRGREPPPGGTRGTRTGRYWPLFTSRCSIHGQGGPPPSSLRWARFLVLGWARAG
jgi:hypothetical protein